MALVPRTLYPTLSQCRYLNQASLGLVSNPAVAAMHQFLDEVAQHGNLYMTCVHATVNLPKCTFTTCIFSCVRC